MSPLKPSFYSLPFRLPNSKDGDRLEKNEYQKSRVVKATEEQKGAQFCKASFTVNLFERRKWTLETPCAILEKVSVQDKG